MDKINFTDRKLEKPELLNRYKINQVTGQENVFDVVPEQGKIIAEGTPIRAAELNKLQDNSESYVDTKTKLATSYQAQSGEGDGLITPPTLKDTINSRDKIYPVTSSSTDIATLTINDTYLPSNTEKVIRIKPTSHISASGTISISLNGNSPNFLVHLYGVGDTDISLLEKDKVYSIVKTKVNGTTVWICLNYPPYESGSNSNGTYRKWNDGTLECWKIQKASTAIDIAAGGFYVSGHFELGNWAYSFLTVPTMPNPYIIASAGDIGTWSLRRKKPTNVNAGSVQIACPWSQSSASYEAHVYAIGKWK